MKCKCKCKCKTNGCRPGMCLKYLLFHILPFDKTVIWHTTRISIFLRTRLVAKFRRKGNEAGEEECTTEQNEMTHRSEVRRTKQTTQIHNILTIRKKQIHSQGKANIKIATQRVNAANNRRGWWATPTTDTRLITAHDFLKISFKFVLT
jgi:hypothetical protein